MAKKKVKGIKNKLWSIVPITNIVVLVLPRNPAILRLQVLSLPRFS